MQRLVDSLVQSTVPPKAVTTTEGRTLGTATSVGGAGVTVWFSIFYPNPLKYTDPDGMAEVRLGIGISGAAIKLKIKFKDGKLTLGAKIGAGAGLEGKVILTDEAQDVGIRGAVLLEGSTEVKLGEAAIGLDAVISADTNGETENRASATINVPGTDLGVEITVDKGVIETGVSESVEYGISAMIFAGVEYESTVEF